MHAHIRALIYCEDEMAFKIIAQVPLGYIRALY